MSDESIINLTKTTTRENFSGPEGLRHHRKSVFKWPEDVRYVGHDMLGPSKESSSDVKYILRYPDNTPFPKPNRTRIGEIGYGVDKFHSRYQSGMTGEQMTVKLPYLKTPVSSLPSVIFNVPVFKLFPFLVFPV